MPQIDFYNTILLGAIASTLASFLSKRSFTAMAKVAIVLIASFAIGALQTWQQLGASGLTADNLASSAFKVFVAAQVVFMFLKKQISGLEDIGPIADSPTEALSSAVASILASPVTSIPDTQAGQERSGVSSAS
jgi:hypothetical protein